MGKHHWRLRDNEHPKKGNPTPEDLCVEAEGTALDGCLDPVKIISDAREALSRTAESSSLISVAHVLNEVEMLIRRSKDGDKDSALELRKLGNAARKRAKLKHGEECSAGFEDMFWRLIRHVEGVMMDQREETMAATAHFIVWHIEVETGMKLSSKSRKDLMGDVEKIIHNTAKRVDEGRQGSAQEIVTRAFSLPLVGYRKHVTRVKDAAKQRKNRSRKKRLEDALKVLEDEVNSDVQGAEKRP